MSEYYFTEMPPYNEKAQYFQRSFMQNYDSSEDASVDYVKRKGLLHLFGFTVLSKKEFHYCVIKSFIYGSKCADTNLVFLNRFLFEFWLSSEVMCFLLRFYNQQVCLLVLSQSRDSLFIVYSAYIFFESI